MSGDDFGKIQANGNKMQGVQISAYRQYLRQLYKTILQN